VVVNCGRAQPTCELLAHCCAIAGGARALELDKGRESKKGSVRWVYGGRAFRDALDDRKSSGKKFWIGQIPGIYRAVQKHRLAEAFRLPLDGMKSAALGQRGETVPPEKLEAISVRESGISFMPRTWVLPAEYDEACAEISAQRRKSKGVHTWIFKPSDQSCGRGIGLVRSVADLTQLCSVKLREKGKHGDRPGTYSAEPDSFDFRKDTKRTAVLQEYVERPMTHGGRKFDLRLYVTLVHRDGEDGWTVLVCREGLARVCAVEYSSPKRDNMGDVYRHLTNFTLNKSHAEFDQCDVNGNCLLASVVLRQLEQEGRLPDGGAEGVWRKVDRGMVETAARIRAFLGEDLRAQGFIDSSGMNSGGDFFHLLGVDVLLTSKGEPFLLEVNPQPIITVDAVYKVVDCGLRKLRKARLTEQIVSLSADVQHWFTLRAAMGKKLPSASGGKDDTIDGWDTVRREFATMVKLNRVRNKGRKREKYQGLPHWVDKDIERLKKSLDDMKQEEEMMIPEHIPVTLPGVDKFAPTKSLLACLNRFHPRPDHTRGALEELDVPSCSVPVPKPTGTLAVCRCRGLAFPHVHLPAPNDYRANVPAVLQALAEVCPAATIGERVSRDLVDGLVRRFVIRVPPPLTPYVDENKADLLGATSSADECDLCEPAVWHCDSCDDSGGGAEDLMSEARARLPLRIRPGSRGTRRALEPVQKAAKPAPQAVVGGESQGSSETGSQPVLQARPKSSVTPRRSTQVSPRPATTAEAVYASHPRGAASASKRSRTRETIAWEVPDEWALSKVRPTMPLSEAERKAEAKMLSPSLWNIPQRAIIPYFRSSWGFVHVDPQVMKVTLSHVNERAATLRRMRREAKEAARNATFVF